MNGLNHLAGNLSVSKTHSKIKKLLKEKGFHIFAEISHSNQAKKNKRTLRPTELIIFGNPKTGGTGLMQDTQTTAIDLPAKILVWEDEDGHTHITYNDMQWVAKRHALSEKSLEIAKKLNGAIQQICQAAVKN